MNRTIRFIFYNIILTGIMLPFWAVGFLVGFFWCPVYTGFLKGRDA